MISKLTRGLIVREAGAKGSAVLGPGTEGAYTWSYLHYMHWMGALSSGFVRGPAKAVSGPAHRTKTSGVQYQSMQKPLFMLICGM